MIIKSRQSACMLIVATSISLLPMMGFAKEKHIMTTDLLQNLKQGEPWDRGVFTATKTVMFQKTSGDATAISKITLSYFTTNNCSGAGQGSNPGSYPNPSYTTPNGTSFSISVGTPFGLVASSAWSVGNVRLGISDANMANIQSIAVTFKSTNNNTPQANFSGISFACIPVTCTAGPSGQCTSGSGTQNFTLKTTTSIGDPADGGVIGCKNTGVTPNLYDLVVPSTDTNNSIYWGPSSPSTGTTSITTGRDNTATIVSCFTGPGGGAGCPMNISVGTYAAGICSAHSASGGYTTNWFLPARQQLLCLYNNRVAIGGFGASEYWSSSQASTEANAWRTNFSNGSQNGVPKSNAFRVRCSQEFVP